MASVGSTYTSPQVNKPLGTFTYLAEENPSQPGVDGVTLISETVPGGKSWNIYSVILDAGVQCRCKIYYGITLIGSFRTGAAKPTGAVKYDLPYSLPAGADFSVVADFTDGFPIVETGCFVQLTEV